MFSYLERLQVSLQLNLIGIRMIGYRAMHVFLFFYFQEAKKDRLSTLHRTIKMCTDNLQVCVGVSKCSMNNLKRLYTHFLRWLSLLKKHDVQVKQWFCLKLQLLILILFIGEKDSNLGNFKFRLLRKRCLKWN